MPVLSGQTRVIPMTKIRTAIATALQRSKQQVPHFYETIDIDMEAINYLRERLNERLEKENVRLSIMDFIYKAVAGALLRHPALNARFNADKGEITQYGDVNLGIAVAIPDGLIVPVLRGINQMGLRDIRLRTTDLFDRARAQRLKREEQSEATFSISALGTYGIRDFSAIINPPEVGILAVGAAEKRPVVRDNQIVARTTMSVTLSCDHRAVDGATAAEFLRTLKEILEEPGLLLVQRLGLFGWRVTGSNVWRWSVHHRRLRRAARRADHGCGRRRDAEHQLRGRARRSHRDRRARPAESRRGD